MLRDVALCGAISGVREVSRDDKRVSIECQRVSGYYAVLWNQTNKGCHGIAKGGVSKNSNMCQENGIKCHGNGIKCHRMSRSVTENHG